MSAKAYNNFPLARLLWNNLKARPVRTAVSVAGIALQVCLVLFVVGLTSGIVSDWSKRVQGVGADLLVQPPNASIFFALSNAVMQESDGARIAALPGVDQVAPVLLMMNAPTLDLVYGIDYPSFNGLSEGFVYLRCSPPSAPDDLLTDDIKSQSMRLRVGDKVLLFGQDFNVCGIVAHGKGARFFISLDKAQDIAGADKRVSMFYVRSTGDTEKTREQIVALLPNHRVRSMAEYLTLLNSDQLPELKPFVRSLIIVGVLISFLVVLLTMYTLVLERAREIGILKAIGAGRANIVGLILGEALLMAILGIVVGLVATRLARAVLHEAKPALAVLITWDWYFRSVVLALAGSVAGALYPAFRAAGSEPVEALAYE
jgi:putative ABC transport system permease protein